MWYNIFSIAKFKNKQIHNMISNNSVLYSVKILAEIGRDLLFFPLWWYSTGLVNFAKSILNFLSGVQKSLALFVWVKNIFTPMFGQSDWQGKIISFFIRFFQIIFRSIVMLVFVCISILVFVFWIIFPPLVIYEIIFQIL